MLLQISCPKFKHTKSFVQIELQKYMTEKGTSWSSSIPVRLLLPSLTNSCSLELKVARTIPDYSYPYSKRPAMERESVLCQHHLDSWRVNQKHQWNQGWYFFQVGQDIKSIEVGSSRIFPTLEFGIWGSIRGYEHQSGQSYHTFYFTTRMVSLLKLWSVLFETVKRASRHNKRAISLFKENKAIELDQMEPIRLTGCPELTYERLMSLHFI